ncbi:MAG: hypothetical protein PHE70_10525 [Tepidanaerobacteraceae bacterium]|nr:hypothetical protein [Tepidanaerobacteraceae bacterium]
MAGFYFNINIGSINIGSIENASAFSIGRNFLREFDSITKTNQGLGNISGSNNSFPSNINHVEDPDGLDMWCGSFDGREKEMVERLKEIL